MSTGNSPQVWRVECDDGVREVTLLRNGHGSLVVRGASPIDLDAIEARANAATAGPWKADHELGHVYAGEYGDTVVCSRDDNTNGADLDFIAHTREDVDVLRAEVRRLRGALAHLHRGEDR